MSLSGTAYFNTCGGEPQVLASPTITFDGTGNKARIYSNFGSSELSKYFDQCTNNPYKLGLQFLNATPTQQTLAYASGWILYYQVFDTETGRDDTGSPSITGVFGNDSATLTRLSGSTAAYRVYKDKTSVNSLNQEPNAVAKLA